MRACEQIRPELIGYAAGTLDELQRSVVAGHLELCADCRREVVELEETTGFVAGAAVEHRPPEDLEEQVFAMLDHLPEAELVATAAIEHMPPEDLERRSLERAGVLAGTRSWWDRNAPRLSPALAIASLVLAGLGMNWRGDAQTFQNRITTLEGHYGKWGQPMGTVDLAGTGAMSDAEVTAQLVSFQQENHRVVLYTDGLPPTPAGHHYEIWLVGEEGRVSCGSFKVDELAKFAFPFTVGVDPMDYPELEITLEPSDGAAGPEGEVVMEAELAGMAHK